MLHLLITVTLLNLLAAMAPGPDFAIVTRNAILYSRRSGIFTSLGIASAVMIHGTYSSLGLALIITHSPLLFTIVKIIGGCYLIYIGLQSFKKQSLNTSLTANQTKAEQDLTRWQAFRQGFLTNLTNPKCMLFFIALFSMVVSDSTPHWEDAIFVIAFFCVTLIWFTALSIMLSHRCIEPFLTRWQGFIIKLTGIFLICFGIALFFAQA